MHIKKAFSLIELVIVLIIVGIISATLLNSLSIYTKYKLMEAQIQNVKHLKKSLLPYSINLESLKRKLNYLALSRKFYVIYSQAYLKTYPYICSYFENSPKYFDEKFIKLKSYYKIYPNVLYFLVLDSNSKLDKDFYILKNNYFIQKNGKLFVIPITLDEVLAYCSKISQVNILDINKTLEPFGYTFSIFYPLEKYYILYSLNNKDKILLNGTEINFAFEDLESGINKLTLYLYDKNNNLKDIRNVYFLVPPTFSNTDLNVEQNETSIKIYLPNTQTKSTCFIDFGDGKYLYLPNCEKYSYIYHNYLYKGTFKLKIFINSTYSSYFTKDIIINTSNIKSYVDLIDNKTLYFSNVKNKTILIYLNNNLLLNKTPITNTYVYNITVPIYTKTPLKAIILYKNSWETKFNKYIKSTFSNNSSPNSYLNTSNIDTIYQQNITPYLQDLEKYISALNQSVSNLGSTGFIPGFGRGYGGRGKRALYNQISEINSKISNITAALSIIYKILNLTFSK